MAPPPRTYGKKRSFFGSLSSRHRSRISTDSLPAKNPDHGSPSVNTSYDAVKQRTKSQKNVQTASIDEIASALLDDSDSEMAAEEDAMQQSEMGILDYPSSTAPALEASAAQVEEQLITPYSPSASKERTTSNSRSYRAGAPRVQKTSPNKFTKTPRPRGNSTSSPKRKDFNLNRPLADPVKKSASRSSYIVLKDTETVCLLPHKVMDGAPRVLYQGDVADQGCAAAASADEIQEKVCAMLAATDALKPSPSQAQSKKSPVSKVTRMTPSRMLAKVSSAWDRWQVKPTGTSAANPHAKLTKQPIRYDPNGPLTSHPVFHSPPVQRSSLIDTIEIRLNEGDNLNRKKVQQMVGGRVARKPVANDGNALRSGRPMDDDPFAEPAPYRQPSVVESRAKMKIMLGPSVSSLLIIDPFEAEKGFESNLEDRILSSSPVCASTPRIHLYRVQTPTAGGGVSEHRSKVPTQMDPEKVTTDLSVYPSQEAVSLGKAPDHQAQLRPLPNTDRIAIGFLRDAPSLDACHVKWSKKHPSPSKRDLEELEIAFRCYSELKRRGIGEEADELAAHYTPSARYLSPRDTNKLMRTREEDDPSQSACEAQSPAKSHMRRPTDEARRRQHIRLAPIYRPAILHSDEIDELQ
ncbi:hypothetical protein M440DRAFT_1446026 [Trichoderma longibrachiatum ATCC 18648]|uniref:Uncharacterized protein n=1 Tax=Trichoderma longibrachiatum ATCC 18648 TaxID=983965 RepID=A0A2T4BYR9_TRILO|nr:hypothetical protein M440DRAFT_1446026 [Trichoderma longibrachiatum ATCC 18648]